MISLNMKMQIAKRMPAQTPPPSHYLFFPARVASRGGFRPRASARSGATTTATSIANASSSASTSTTTNSTSNTHHNQNKNLKVQPPAWRASGQPHPAWRASGQRGITYPSPPCVAGVWATPTPTQPTLQTWGREEGGSRTPFASPRRTTTTTKTKS